MWQTLHRKIWWWKHTDGLIRPITSAQQGALVLLTLVIKLKGIKSVSVTYSSFYKMDKPQCSQAICKSIWAGWHKLSRICTLALLLNHKPASELTNEPLLKIVRGQPAGAFSHLRWRIDNCTVQREHINYELWLADRVWVWNQTTFLKAYKPYCLFCRGLEVDLSHQSAGRSYTDKKMGGGRHKREYLQALFTVWELTLECSTCRAQ